MMYPSLSAFTERVHDFPGAKLDRFSHRLECRGVPATAKPRQVFREWLGNDSCIILDFGPRDGDVST